MSFRVFIATLLLAFVSVIAYDHTGDFPHMLSTLVCAIIAALFGVIAVKGMDNE